MSKITMTLNADETITVYTDGKKSWRGAMSGLAAYLKGDEAPKPTPKKAAKPKQESRAKRWSDACDRAKSAIDDLVDLKGEFEDWKDNLEGKFEGSALVEKLEAVCELDLDSVVSTLDEAEGLDLPLGFGRD